MLVFHVVHRLNEMAGLLLRTGLRQDINKIRLNPDNEMSSRAVFVRLLAEQDTDATRRAAGAFD
jgi:hypothetical protein